MESDQFLKYLVEAAMRWNAGLDARDSIVRGEEGAVSFLA